MKKKFFCTGLFVVLLTLPSFSFENRFMTQMLRSWHGFQPDKMVSVWGYPDNQGSFSGRKLYYWHLKHSTGVSYYPYTKQASINEKYCTVIVETDTQNIIQGGQYKGNDCPFLYIANKKYVNPENDFWEIEKQQKELEKSNK